MELYKELLTQVLSRSEVRVTFPDLTMCAAEIAQTQSYLALKKIKAILEDDRLDDPECFAKIEAIVRVFEESGSSVSYRHDFG